MRIKEHYSLILRYFLILFLGFNFYIFYIVLRPLTIYPLLILFRLFYDVTLNGTIFIFNTLNVNVIDACIAGSAYYLLFSLNMSIPKINLKKRLKMVLFAFTVLLGFNILRIFILSIIAISLNQYFFEITHHFFWHFMNIIFVVFIWFSEVKIFNLNKKIPFYTDIKSLYENSILKKKGNKS